MKNGFFHQQQQKSDDSFELSIFKIIWEMTVPTCVDDETNIRSTLTLTNQP